MKMTGWEIVGQSLGQEGAGQKNNPKNVLQAPFGPAYGVAHAEGGIP